MTEFSPQPTSHILHTKEETPHGITHYMFDPRSAYGRLAVESQDPRERKELTYNFRRRESIYHLGLNSGNVGKIEYQVVQQLSALYNTNDIPLGYPELKALSSLCESRPRVETPEKGKSYLARVIPRDTFTYKNGEMQLLDDAYPFVYKLFEYKGSETRLDGAGEEFTAILPTQSWQQRHHKGVLEWHSRSMYPIVDTEAYGNYEGVAVSYYDIGKRIARGGSEEELATYMQVREMLSGFWEVSPEDIKVVEELLEPEWPV